MKSRRTIKHIIEQRTANRKNARRRKRPLFRLEAKAGRIQTAKQVVAQVNKEN